MLDRRDIEAVLVKEVGKRKAEYNRCNARMASLALRLFGDERERIKDAGRANDQALEAWAKALEELNIFILSGTVPEWIAQTTRIARRCQARILTNRPAYRLLL